MGACREGASIWHWLFKKKIHGNRKDFFKRKIWKNEYFWHDSLGKYFNRLIGCRITGHKRTWMEDGTCEKDKPLWYCFRCEKEIDCK